MAKVTPMKNRRKINLALQGGGAHGAFAWGVLDSLLEDGRVDIEAVCATSAGTMNALALGYGMHLGSQNGRGPEQARETLETFWKTVSERGQMYSPVAAWSGLGSVEYSPGWNLFDTMTRTLSPYQWNIFDVNPLRDVLHEVIDFDELRHCKCLKLFISATNVRSGKVTVFEENELTCDVALASACLPSLFKTIEIGDEAYWDGGFMGNPSLFPLFNKTQSRDVVIVHINPIERPDIPHTAPEIMNRINEISFNSSLLKDIRTIAFIKKLIQNDMLKPGFEKRFKDILVHSIRAEESMCQFSVASKFDTSWSFLTLLKDRGRATGKRWLQDNFDDLGVRDTVDLHNEFLSSVGQIFEGMDEAI